MAVKRILQQWIELKLHFNMAAKEEKCFKAQTLHSLFSDEVNHLYLLFLHPVLTEMQNINKIFQSKNANSSKLLRDLLFAINSLKTKIIPPTVDIDILKDDFEHITKRDLYLGYAFESKLQELKERIPCNMETEIRFKCTNFIISLINELRHR